MLRLNCHYNLIVFCYHCHSEVDRCTLFLLIGLFLQKQQNEVLLLCYQSIVPAPTKVSSVLVLFVMF